MEKEEEAEAEEEEERGEGVNPAGVSLCRCCSAQTPKSTLCRRRGVIIDDLRPHEMNDPTVYIPAKYSQKLLISTQFLIIPCLAAVYFGQYFVGSSTVLVYFTSLNHWRKPRLCWRRTFDVLAVCWGLLTHGIAALTVWWPYGAVWWLCLVSVVLIYVNGRHAGSQGNHKRGSKLHFCVHLIGASANTLLYYGLFIYYQLYEKNFR